MNMQKLIVPTILILAVTGIIFRSTQEVRPDPTAVPPVIADNIESVSGMFTYGHEVRSFVPCGDMEKNAAWITFTDPKIAADIRQKYEFATLDRIPYTPVYATLQLEKIDPLTEGFGAEYSSAFVVSGMEGIKADRNCQQEEIILSVPLSGGPVVSPQIISGQALGTWFFEGSMSAVITNWDGLIIGEAVLTAQEDWMTEEMVPFSGEIEFDSPQPGQIGHLIIQAANPSDMPENEKFLEIIVEFAHNDSDEI